MKKKLLLSLLVIFGYSFSGFGQDRSGLEFGLQQHVLFSKFYGNRFVHQNHFRTLGYGRSFYLQYNSGRLFSVRAEPGFEQKGSRVNFRSTDGNGNQTEARTAFRLNYINLPVLARVTFGEDRVRLFVNAGGYLGYRVGYNSHNLLIVNDTIFLQDLDESAWFRKFDAGVAAGAGITYTVKEVFVLSAEARSSLGLYNISSLPMNNGTLLNNSTSVLLSFGYRIRNK